MGRAQPRDRSFLFRRDDVFKKVSVLSGGEKSRLALVKILLDPPNVLLMDEPTTHLDMPSIDALIDALKQYEGTLLFISHDVYFIRALATSVLHINAGALMKYAGNYDYYLDRTGQAADRGAAAGAADAKNGRDKPKADVAGPETARERRRREAAERETRAKAKRAADAELHRLEEEIIGLEMRQKELTGLLETAEASETPVDFATVSRELGEIAVRLKELGAEWHLAAEEVERFV